MNDRCLLCTQRAATACCLVCGKKDRLTIFETLLEVLGNASVTSNYYNQMKAICQQITTVRLLLVCFKLYSIIHLVGMAFDTDSIRTQYPFRSDFSQNRSKSYAVSPKSIFKRSEHDSN